MVIRRSLALLAMFVFSSLLASCGGGGGGAHTRHAIELGVIDPTAITHSVWFENPHGVSGHIVFASAQGDFGVSQSQFPVAVDATGGFVQLMREPGAAPSVKATIALRYELSGRLIATYFDVCAVADSLIVRTEPDSVDFGSVPLGQHADRTLRVINDSQYAPIEITDALFPVADVTHLSPALPVTIEPSAFVDVTIRYEPTIARALFSPMQFAIDGFTGGLPVPMSLSTPVGGSETVVDLGNVGFDVAGLTAPLNVDVPDDAISVTFEIYGVEADTFGLGSLIGPTGRVYENLSGTGPYSWSPGIEVFSAGVPNTDRPLLGLVPGGGTYTFQMVRLAGSSTEASVRVVIEHRDDVTDVTSDLKLNVWLAPGVIPTAATADSDTRLQAILARASAILSAQGIRIGDVDYYDIASSDYNVILDDAHLAELMRTTSSATDNRLNLAFVQTVFGGGILGASARIAGPSKLGTGASGVASIYEGSTVNFIGLIVAHEIAHFLGLHHTVESDGTHDFIDDTPECPAMGTNAACPEEGGDLLMHWFALGGTTLTPGQGLVLRAHPHVDPGFPPSGSSKFGAGSRRGHLLPWSRADDEAVRRAGNKWCGTCAACRAK